MACHPLRDGYPPQLLPRVLLRQEPRPYQARSKPVLDNRNFIAKNKITTNNLYRSTFLSIGFSIGLAIDLVIKLIYNEKLETNKNKQMLLYIMAPILTCLLALLLGHLTKPNKDIEERSKVEMPSSTIPAVSTVQYRFDTS